MEMIIRIFFVKALAQIFNCFCCHLILSLQQILDQNFKIIDVSQILLNKLQVDFVIFLHKS